MGTRRKLAAGEWSAPGVVRIDTTTGKSFVLKVKRRHEFELGEMAIAVNRVVFLVEKEHTILFKAGLRRIKEISYPDAKTRGDLAKFMPDVQGVHETAKHHIAIIAKTDDVVLLKDLVAHIGGRLPPKHTAWVVSSLLNLACFFEVTGLTHNAISPETIFVAPTHHAAYLLGGWWYATPAGSRIELLPETTYPLMPRSMATSKCADIRLDLESIRALGRTILGDSTGLGLVGREDLPKPMTNFLRLPSSGSAIEDYRAWGQALKDSFGPRRFMAADRFPRRLSIGGLIMGYHRYDADTWSTYATATAAKTHRDYGRTSILSAFDPTVFGMRESRKSELNPNPTPFIAALDVTGSMGRVVEAMRKGLGTLFEQVITRAVIPDPHVLAIAIGDFEVDRAPIQVTQFESEPVTIGKQIEELWLERGGGGNDFEGYLGPLYFAAMRTDCEAIREGRKGFLFTAGDEEPQMVLRKSSVKRFFNDDAQWDLTAEELISLVSRGWEYFHLMVTEGSHMQAHPDRVTRAWTDLIGQRALPLADHTRMAEVIISAAEVASGRDHDTVARSWSGSTSLVVRSAINGLTTSGGRTTKGPRAI